jgi:hypothetical protein
MRLLEERAALSRSTMPDNAACVYAHRPPLLLFGLCPGHMQSLKPGASGGRSWYQQANYSEDVRSGATPHTLGSILRDPYVRDQDATAHMTFRGEGLSYLPLGISIDDGTSGEGPCGL